GKAVAFLTDSGFLQRTGDDAGGAFRTWLRLQSSAVGNNCDHSSIELLTILGSNLDSACVVGLACAALSQKAGGGRHGAVFNPQVAYEELVPARWLGCNLPSTEGG
ncbi:hypothetical protein ACFV6K_06255, partial [Streptomyces sp. NPDC059814]